MRKVRSSSDFSFRLEQALLAQQLETLKSNKKIVKRTFERRYTLISSNSKVERCFCLSNTFAMTTLLRGSTVSSFTAFLNEN